MIEGTRQDMDQGLHELGVSNGDAVEVHSSLSSLGHVVGGAATVVDALPNALGADETVVMSAYRVSPGRRASTAVPSSGSQCAPVCVYGPAGLEALRGAPSGSVRCLVVVNSR
jgi:hypothetical protein